MRLGEWIKDRFERELVSEGTKSFLDEVYSKWKKTQGISDSSRVTLSESTAGLCPFLYFEITNFIATTYYTHLLDRSKNKKDCDEVRKKARVYGHLLKDADRVHKFLKIHPGQVRAVQEGDEFFVNGILGATAEIFHEFLGVRETRKLIGYLTW